MAKDYLPAGVKVDPYAGNEPLLDPDLEKVRDEEAKALSEIKVQPRPEPTIAPELVKLRDEEIARDKKRAKALGGVSAADESPAPAKKTAAKKAAAKKS